MTTPRHLSPSECTERRSRRRALLPFASLLFACGSTVLSVPETRAAEADCELPCPKGYQCELVLGCPERATDVSCEPHPTCTPLPCSSDADCDERMTCNREDNADSTGTCLPSWQLQCEKDSDCGAGFTCAPEHPCLQADTMLDAGTESACKPSGVPVCYIHTSACDADDDCLSGWSCRNNPLNGYFSNTNGETGCSIAEPALICVPPHAPAFGLGAGYLDWQTGVQWSTRRVPESECPAPRPAEYSVGVGFDEPAESDPGDIGAGSASGPNAPGSDDSDDGASRAGTKASEGGCSFTSGGAPVPSTGWVLWGLLLALGGRGPRARRRQASVSAASLR